MEIPVTYQCWGCGSEKIEYEDTEDPIPSKTVWNLCPECREKKGKGGKMRSTAVVMTKALQTKDDRIRKRGSYSVWKQAAEFLDSKPTTTEILRYFHNYLDTNHMYGTEQQAMWSEESLELVIRDRAK